MFEILILSRNFVVYHSTYTLTDFFLTELTNLICIQDSLLSVRVRYSGYLSATLSRLSLEEREKRRNINENRISEMEGEIRKTDIFQTCKRICLNQNKWIQTNSLSPL
jgi:hypothetical protein